LLWSLPLLAGAAVAQGNGEDDASAPIRFGDAEELAYTEAFFPGASYDAALPRPDDFLGQLHGSRLARHDEVLAAFRGWAASSDRMQLVSFGRTHEGRELVYAVVTSPANHERLEEIRGELARLADPRGLSEAEGERLVQRAKGAAWMGYSIHGGELSGTDASMAVAYHLVAGQDPEVTELLDELVVLIDPCLNPDGRQRILGMVEQSAGYTANLDYASMHRGRWPWGRGNHYLFDMNRDWIAGTQPETRARWRAILDWNPQLLVDAHEMWSLDTFLFYPQAAPHNPELPPRLDHWHGVFAAGASAAFDARGWSYYTREWADAWGPFYSDAWASLTGAIGILYEQAATYGFQLRRASGEVLTYREAVHHQVEASWANLTTLRENREAVLRDYLAAKRDSVAAETAGNDQVLCVLPDANTSRRSALRRILDGQGLEYEELLESGRLEGARGARGGSQESLELPAGTLVLPARQPLRRLVRAFFQFDPRVDAATLKEERSELESGRDSKMYDATAWSLPHAFDLDAWWGRLGDVETAEPAELPESGRFDDGVPLDATYGWIVDGRDDAAVAFAARALEAGLVVHLADKEFETAGRAWSRGSLLMRRGEQRGVLQAVDIRIDELAREAGAQALRVRSGRAPGEGPDLGGGHFHLLARPRVAVLANSPVEPDTYGHLWHHLDVVLGVPFSILDAQTLGGADLRRFNVIVLPPAQIEGLGEELGPRLERWMESGGTLVACGGSAAALTSGRMGLGETVLRRHALDELDAFARAVERERAARAVEIDEERLWNGPLDEEPGAEGEEDAEAAPEDEIPLEERDRWMRRFSPSGAFLLAETDPRHWLTVGAGERLPIAASGDAVFLAQEPVEAAVRFIASGELRLAGLLWPEARERLADSAWLTREAIGRGQLLLFAGLPAFRGYHLASGRFFSNAVVYGPGLGTDQPVGW